MRPLKVYGWIGMRSEAKGPHHQTREIMAAPSKAAVARAAGVRSPAQLFNLCQTGNPAEIAAAMALPGIVLWTELDKREKWVAAAQKGQP